MFRASAIPALSGDAVILSSTVHSRALLDVIMEEDWRSA